MLFAAMGEGTYSGIHTFLIDMNNQVKAEFFHLSVAKLNHFAELPGGVDMHQGKRQAAWIKCLQCQVKHDRGVLAYGVQHHWVAELGGDFTDDMDALCFQLLEVGQVVI